MFKRKNIGVYVHVPFCTKKCPYCDFYSIEYNNKNILEKQYFLSVIEEIKSYKKYVLNNKLLADTVYFGGGTPSLVNTNNIKLILKTLKRIFRYKNNSEITVECNPEGVDEQYLVFLKKIGVNRLSFGLQSANDDELYLLGRSHSSVDVEEVVKLAKRVGFKNISVDLILGVPYQTVEKIKRSLSFIERLNVNHVSAYILQIEKNTLFSKKSIIEMLPSDDVTADIYLYVVDKLKEIGFNQYEISNFARPGFESRHNLKYWNREEYIGLGSSSHSFLDNKRYYLENSIYRYIGMGRIKKFEYIYEKDKDKNKDKDQINEYIMLKLRTSDGIILNDMKKYYSEILIDAFLENVKKYSNGKYIYIDNNNLKLTTEGFLIYNTIISSIMVG